MKSGMGQGPTSTDPKALSVLVIDEDEIRASIIRQGLHESGFEQVHVISTMHGLVRAVEDLAPDVIVIDLANPSRDLVEHLSQVSRAVRRPVAMFVDQSDSNMMEAAIQAAFPPMSSMACARTGQGDPRYGHCALQCLFAVAGGTRDHPSALEDRKAIDRAKALLQKLRGVSEEEAYHLIRRKAMRDNRRMGDVARTMLSAAELLTGNDE